MEPLSKDTKKIIKTINKLFLIGNGFDLALGLDTRYSDFLLWLVKKYIKKCLKDSDPDSIRTEQCKFNSNFIDISVENRLKIDSFFNLNDIEQAKNEHNLNIKFKPEYGILNKVFNMKESNWIDIETEYFNLFKSIFNTFYLELKEKDKKERIIELNKELDFISIELQEYLNNQIISLQTLSKQKFVRQFQDSVKIDDEIFFDTYMENRITDFKIGTTYFLNFNYTDTLNYVCDFNPLFIFNQIHGNSHEEIIFGYGDEMDKSYKDIEELNDNELLRHIKSFSYFRRSNYRHLLSFLDSGEFQVCIYGHSCGLSDRVMLNEIFEHKYCHSIRVYFYKDEKEYIEKTMNISRHFTSNKLMRQKIINFNPKNKIPQLKKI
jgi:hypothetical protein